MVRIGDCEAGRLRLEDLRLRDGEVGRLRPGD